jgi:hypothetical protein
MSMPMNLSTLLKSKLDPTTVWLNDKTIVVENKPNYSMGWLCLIPLVGGIVGVVLVINGFIKYNRNLRMIITGIAGILFTVGIYGGMCLFGISKTGRSQFVVFAQSDLNALMKDIEFYKTQNGNYPDSLPQLKTKDDFLQIHDPVQVTGSSKTTMFNYQNTGKKYHLFSSGVDGIP